METIRKYGIALVDGTCYNRFNSMDKNQVNDTMFKTVCLAILCGLIGGVVGGAGAFFFVAGVVALSNFAYLTYHHQPVVPVLVGASESPAPLPHVA